eukprot:COSAG01_NODE_4059_length_5388_cov_99.849121_2_plen_76_part_00
MIPAAAQHHLGWRALGAHARPPGTGGGTPLYLLWRCEGRQRAAARGAAACGGALLLDQAVSAGAAPRDGIVSSCT